MLITAHGNSTELISRCNRKVLTVSLTDKNQVMNEQMLEQHVLNAETKSKKAACGRYTF